MRIEKLLLRILLNQLFHSSVPNLIARVRKMKDKWIKQFEKLWFNCGSRGSTREIVENYLSKKKTLISTIVFSMKMLSISFFYNRSWRTTKNQCWDPRNFSKIPTPTSAFFSKSQGLFWIAFRYLQKKYDKLHYKEK